MKYPETRNSDFQSDSSYGHPARQLCSQDGRSTRQAGCLHYLPAYFNSLLSSTSDDRVCRGTLLSRAQYLVDVQERGYRDGRLHSQSHMGAEDIAHWTAAIEQVE